MELWHGSFQIVFFELIYTIYTGDAESSLKVLQASSQNATAGGTVVLACSFENESWSHIRANWTQKRNQTKSEDLNVAGHNKRWKLSTLEQNKLGEATLTISDARVSDSDVYYCEISVTDTNKATINRKGKGDGTKLLVIEKQNGKKQGDAESSLKVLQASSQNATAGGTVVLACSFENESWSHIRATWIRKRNQTKSEDLSVAGHNKRWKLSSLEQNKLGEATLTISDARVSDSDVYYCEISVTDENKVNISRKGKGDGTKVLVIEKQNGKKQATLSTPMAKDAWLGVIIMSFLTGLMVFGGILGCCLSSYMPLKVKADMVGGSVNK